MLILGRGALARADGAAVLAAAWQVAARHNMLRPDWHGFNLLHLFGGQVGAAGTRLRAGAGRDLPQQRRAARRSGCSAPTASTPRASRPTTFVIYQGHHGEAAAARADVILPGAAYTEKDGDLGEHRGPRAARPPRRLPAGRGARGLEDHPRARARCSARGCPTTRWPPCARAWRRPTRSSRGRTAWSAAAAPTRPGRRAIRRRCRTRRPSRCRSRITGRRTHQPRVGDHGGVRARAAARGRRAGADRGGVGGDGRLPRHAGRRSRPSPWRRRWPCWCRCCSPSPTSPMRSARCWRRCSSAGARTSSGRSACSSPSPTRSRR